MVESSSGCHSRGTGPDHRYNRRRREFQAMISRQFDHSDFHSFCNDATGSISINIAWQCLPDFCVCMALLQENEVDACKFRNTNDECALVISKKSEPCHAIRVSKIDIVTTKIDMSAAEFGSVYLFSLRALRDGAPQVDHLDFYSQDIENEIEIIFKFGSPYDSPIVDDVRRKHGYPVKHAQRKPRSKP
jgi:hypothetical protein